MWSRPICWTATLSDGRVVVETAPELQEHEDSPWRTLERLAREQGVSITFAAQESLGGACGLHAQGYPLECGQAWHQTRGLTGGSVVTTHYHFVCRLELTKRVWVVVDAMTGEGWLLEGPPGQAMCPDPRAK